MTAKFPVVLNTWPWTNGTQKAWDVLASGNSGMDALVAGCTVIEEDPNVKTVGVGGSIDECGEPTQDALVMDGPTHSVGAVGCLRRVRKAIAVARAVMDYTEHTMLVGDLATKFAVESGFKEESLISDETKKMLEEWKENKCQPNYRKGKNKGDGCCHLDEHNHDTVGMIVIDEKGDIVAGTSTNGMNHKVPGRVGDSPIAGSGAYVDNEVGACVATGDGDIMMRYLPAFHVVELMRQGKSPAEACTFAIQKIRKQYKSFEGAMAAINTKGEHGGACVKFTDFSYSIRDATMDKVLVIPVSPMTL